MKRYDLYWDGRSRVAEDERHDGDWVKYEDAQAAIQEAVLAERDRARWACINARPSGGRAWSEGQQAVYEALSHVADYIGSQK